MHDSPNEFFIKLRSIYDTKPHLHGCWEAEGPLLEQIVPAVAKEIAFNYDLVCPLAVGGSGVVALVTDRNLNAKRALKISRPSPGKRELLAKILVTETENLRRVVHHNLIRIFAQGATPLGQEHVPYYIMDFIEGAADSDEYLSKSGRSEQDLIDVFRGMLSAVVYLHTQEQIHMDLKPANVLVSPAGTPIVSDLGFAKRLTLASGHTLIGGTEGFIHPDARKLVQEAQSDPNRLMGEGLRSSLKPTWDLFSLGKTFLALVRAFGEGNPRALPAYSKRYLKLLACRLLDGQNTQEELALGLSVEVFSEISYKTAAQALEDFDKLTGAYNLNARIPELNPFVQDTIQVSTLATTPFTERVGSLLAHPSVMRLGTCTQLGLLNLIYPTATHTRLEHSVGTFSVLCQMMLALYNDPLNPLFRQIMNEEDLRAGLLAGLLHDLGQYPLAHDLEEADKSTFSHEDIGHDILANPASTIRDIIENPKLWAVPAARVVSVLSAKPSRLQGTLKDRVMYSLISGPIDADKIDYLIRDSNHLGLVYGKSIDFARLLRCLTIVVRRQDDKTYAALGIHEKGKIPAESIAFARYAMFGQVYWHHAYRSIKAMLHRMAWEALEAAGQNRQQTFRDEFRAFATGVAATSSTIQGTLWPQTSTSGSREVCQLHPGDRSVLAWLGG